MRATKPTIQWPVITKQGNKEIKSIFGPHPEMEKKLNVPANHVIIDRDHFLAIMIYLDKGNQIPGIKRRGK